MSIDVMIDLETLGTSAGCSIISIGAVTFNCQIESEFYTSVSRSSCKEYGLFEDEKTIKWWESQSNDARKVFDEDQVPLDLAMENFSNWILSLGDDVRVWGNGADFDNAMLQFIFRAIGKDVPWVFWNNRCYRTLKSLRPDIEFVRFGTYHNALDDAKSQAIHADKILNLVK